MKYLCLIYENEQEWMSLPEETMRAILGDYREFRETTTAAGKFVGGHALQPTETATTVRVRDGKISTTDGPFMETKEQLGGYILVEAADLNDAIQVASRIPAARRGAIEVRPVMIYQLPPDGSGR